MRINMILLEFNNEEIENEARVMIKAFFPNEKIVTVADFLHKLEDLI